MNNDNLLDDSENTNYADRQSAKKLSPFTISLLKDIGETDETSDTFEELLNTIEMNIQFVRNQYNFLSAVLMDAENRQKMNITEGDEKVLSLLKASGENLVLLYKTVFDSSKFFDDIMNEISDAALFAQVDGGSHD